MCKCSDAILLAVVFAFSACTTGHDILPPEADEGLITVSVEASTLTAFSTQPVSASGHTVNKVLVLPFRKIDESLPENTADNFAAVFSAARQFDINASPAFYNLLKLAPDCTWTVILLGYNKADYNHANPNAPGTRFSFGSVGETVTLADIYLQPTNPESVPGFFSAQCTLYSDNVLVGDFFRLADNCTNKLCGTLTRMVSGLEMTLENIPSYVTSVAIGATRLVRASAPLTGEAVLASLEGESTDLILGQIAPEDGTASISTVLLPAFGGNETSLFLDITYYGATERHTVKLPDTGNLVKDNQIAFRPNELVSIKGDYASLDVGFHITGTIGLDDDEWDGLQ